MRWLNLKPISHDHRSRSNHRWHRTAEESNRLFEPVKIETMNTKPYLLSIYSFPYDNLIEMTLSTNPDYIPKYHRISPAQQKREAKRRRNIRKHSKH